MFDQIVKEVANRFAIGDKALPLVQMLVATMLNKDTHGLQGFIDRFKSRGLGHLIDSWTQDSAPLNINHTQIEEVFGGPGGLLDNIGRKIGLDKGTSLLSLAYLLPNLCKMLTQKGDTGGDISGFIGQGAALLAASGVAAAASAATSTVAASVTKAEELVAATAKVTAPVTPPTPMPAASVAPVTASSEVTSAPKIATSAPKPTSFSHATSNPMAVDDDDDEENSGLWKLLLWLLPLGLGALILMNVGGENSKTNTAPETEHVAPIGSTSSPTTVAESTPALEKATPAGQEVIAPPSPTSESGVSNNHLPQEATASGTSNGTNIENTAPAVQAPTQVKKAAEPATEQSGLPSAKIYFAVSKTNLPEDAVSKLKPVVAYLKAHSGKKVTLSGFHDPTGNQARNATLAKLRATEVKAKLLANGIAKNAIVMQKPQSSVGTGNNEEARRVEVNISQ